MSLTIAAVSASVVHLAALGAVMVLAMTGGVSGRHFFCPECRSKVGMWYLERNITTFCPLLVLWS